MTQHAADPALVAAHQQHNASAFLAMESDLIDALCMSRIAAKLLEDVEGDGTETLCFAVTELRDRLNQ